MNNIPAGNHFREEKRGRGRPVGVSAHWGDNHRRQLWELQLAGRFAHNPVNGLHKTAHTHSPVNRPIKKSYSILSNDQKICTSSNQQKQQTHDPVSWPKKKSYITVREPKENSTPSYQRQKYCTRSCQSTNTVHDPDKEPPPPKWTPWPEDQKKPAHDPIKRPKARSRTYWPKTKQKIAQDPINRPKKLHDNFRRPKRKQHTILSNDQKLTYRPVSGLKTAQDPVSQSTKKNRTRLCQWTKTRARLCQLTKNCTRPCQRTKKLWEDQKKTAHHPVKRPNTRIRPCQATNPHPSFRPTVSH